MSTKRRSVVQAVITAVLFAVAVVLTPGVSGAIARFPTASSDGPSGLPRLMPLDVAVVIDDSGSTKQSDPGNQRYTAARFATDMLASLATSGLDHRVAVVHFGSTAPSRLTLGLTAAEDPAIAAALTAPAATLGDTDFAAALTRAREVLGPPASGRAQAVLLYTDGEADTGDGRRPEVLFADIASVLGTLPRTHVHVLGLDDDGTFSRDLPRWQGLGVGSVERVSGLTTAALGQRFGTILAAETGLATDGEQRLAQAGDVAAVDVGPYREALSVRSFSPDAGAVIEIVDPAGKVAGRLGPGRVAIHTVRLPVPGRWLVRLAAGANASVAAAQVPLQARLVGPGPTAPLGRALIVEATFMTSAGSPMAEQAGYPRYFGAVVSPPAGPPQALSLHEEEPGRYLSQRGIPTTRAGTYTVQLVMKGGTATVLDRVAQTVEVRAAAYLAAQPATVVPGRPIAVAAELRLAGHPVDATAVLGEDPAGAAVTRLQDSRGRVVVSGRLDWLGGARFQALFPYRPRSGERLNVTLELASKDKAGVLVTDTVTVPVAAHRTAAMVWAGRGRTALLTLLVAVAVLVALWWGWMLSHRRLHGRYQVDGARVLTLSGRRHAHVGGGWPRRPVTWIWGSRNGALARTGRLPLPFGARLLAGGGSTESRASRTPPRRTA